MVNKPAGKSAQKAASKDAEKDKPEAGDTGPALQAATLQGGALVPPARNAEDMEAAAREQRERQHEVAQNLGAHARDEKGVAALAEVTNAVSGTDVSTLPASTVVREPEAGFVRHGEQVAALGASARMLPLQNAAPISKEFPKAVTNQPFGSEPGFVDAKTGVRTFQPKTPEHLAGQGVKAEDQVATTEEDG